MSSDPVELDAIVVAVEDLIPESFDPSTLSSQFIYKQVEYFTPFAKMLVVFPFGKYSFLHESIFHCAISE